MVLEHGEKQTRHHRQSSDDIIRQADAICMSQQNDVCTQ